MSDAPLQFGSVPPPPSAAPARRGPSKAVVAVVALAALVAIGGAGVLISGAGHNADASRADSTRSVAPSSAVSASIAPSGTATVDQARIDAIIADAHTGKYFSNAHAAGYPLLFETGFVKGGLASQPNLPNAMAACMLSYVETTWSFPALMKHTDRAKQIGVAAGLHCVKYS